MVLLNQLFHQVQNILFYYWNFKSMKIIELRRHSTRLKSSPHLTQEGVEKARRVGETLGKFDLVISSKAPRAIETAVAMGYAVNQIMEEISMTPDNIETEVQWGMNFHQYSEVIKQGKKTAEYSSQMALIVKDIANMVSENESILIVSHGGLIEITTIGCFPLERYTDWGAPLDTCEGIRIYLEDNEFKKIELLRV